MLKRYLAATIALLLLCLVAGCTRDPKARRQKFLESGQKYAAKGNLSAANIEYRNAVAADPQSAEAHYRLALSYLDLRIWPEAYRELARTLELDPKNVDALSKKATLELASGNAEDGTRTLQQALALDEKNIDARLLLGQALVQQRKFDAAWEEGLKTQQIAPNAAKVLTHLGDIQVVRGKPAEAEGYYRQAIEREPQFFTAYLQLAQLFRLQGKPEAEAEVLRVAVRNNPRVIPAYTVLATMYLRQGAADKLASLFAELLAATSNSRDAVNTIAGFYLRVGNPQEARRGLEAAIVNDADNLVGRKLLIESCLQMQDWEKADTYTAELQRQRPRDVDARLFRAWLLLGRDKKSEAVTALQELVHDAPDMAKAHFALGLAYSSQGNTARAISSLNEALSRDPNMLFGYVVLGGIHLSQGNPKEALAIAERGLQRNGLFIPAILLRVNANLQMEKTDSALADLRRLAAAVPGNAVVQERLGVATLKQSKFAEAEKALERALELDPNLATAMQDIMLLYRAQHREAQIAGRIRKQIERVPTQSAYYELLGNAHFDAQDLAGAEQAYREALRHNPDAFFSNVQLARIYAQQQKHAEAVSNAKRALALRPDYLGTYLLLAGVYEQQGEIPNAQQVYEKALQKNPDFAPALNNLAWLYAEHGGNIDMALAYAQRAKTVMPDSAEITDTLAWIQYRKGLYAPAARLLQDLVRKSPEVGLYRYHLGMAQWKAGAKTDARASLKRALELNLSASKAEEVRKALQELNSQTQGS